MTFVVAGVVTVASFLGWMVGDYYVFTRFGFSPRFLESPLQLYRVVTSSLFHLDLQHLLGNLAIFFLFSLTIERHHPDTYLGLLIFSGVSSTLGTTLMYFLYDEEVISVGFSGVVYGVIAAFLAERPTHDFLGFIPGWIVGLVYLVKTLWEAATHHPDDHTDHFGHLGGAVGGLLYAEVVWF